MTERASVLVVGSINVDLVVHAERLPAPGETVAGGRLERTGGGKGANQAVAAARAGAAVALVGAVGDDDFGAAALEDLRAEGVDVSAVRRLDGCATGVALIVVDRSGDNQIAVASGANHEVTAEDVEAAAGALGAPASGAAAEPDETAASGPAAEPDETAASGPAAEPDETAASGPAAEPDETAASDPAAEPDETAASGPAAEPDETAASGPAAEPDETAASGPAAPGCVLASFELRDAPVLAAARIAAAAGCPLLVNPAPARPLAAELRALQPIITPNRTEATELTGEEKPEAAARALTERTGAPVVVTLGDQGALVLDAAGCDRIPAPAVRAVDTTGAGDAFNGVLAAQLARGRDLRAAVAEAVTAAAQSVTRSGARG